VNRSGARICVGVLLNSLELPAWQFAVVESIVKSDCADLALIALRQGSAPARGIVHRAFLQIEDMKRRPEPDACTTVSVLPLIHSIDRIAYPGPDASQTESAWLQSIRARDLDVLLILADSADLTVDVSLARWAIGSMRVTVVLSRLPTGRWSVLPHLFADVPTFPLQSRSINLAIR
jgi:hypothetical protein